MCRRDYGPGPDPQFKSAPPCPFHFGTTHCRLNGDTHRREGEKKNARAAAHYSAAVIRTPAQCHFFCMTRDETHCAPIWNALPYNGHAVTAGPGPRLRRSTVQKQSTPCPCRERLLQAAGIPCATPRADRTARWNARQMRLPWSRLFSSFGAGEE
ncbi:hypothetical protein NA57DRAFT_56237 [Rhizodiscina lignyota]|uniref:Uncharacterized protein n=1 Tax=Rhizodiscina lignyota TaxID=1504668 RepID=A0A9P4IFY9_9PEZI|nr:hypothetical protein NA57DRAFT_56237 [Rhizodiscina lignyota]